MEKLLLNAQETSPQWFADLEELLTGQDFYNLTNKVGSWNFFRKSYDTEIKEKLTKEEENNDYYDILWQLAGHFDKKIKKTNQLKNLLNNLKQEEQRTREQQPTFLDNKLSKEGNLRRNKEFIAQYLQILGNATEYETQVKNLVIESWKDIHPNFVWKNNTSGKTDQQHWQEVGLNYQDAQILISAGFGPWDYDKVKQWKNYNFTPQENEYWIELGFRPYILNQVLAWKKEFASDQVKEFIEVGFFSYSGLEYAKKWKDLGFSFEEIEEWIKAGLNPYKADFVKHLKQNNIKPSQLTTDNLFQLRKEFYRSSAQAYLEQHYPWKERKKLKELNLRNLNLEGNLDLAGFGSSWDNRLKIYLSGNPNLGKIKNKPDKTILIYHNPQECLNYQYVDKEKSKKINLKDLDFEQPGELIIDGCLNLRKVKIEKRQLQEIHDVTKLTISNCPRLEEIDISRLKNNQQLILNNLPNLNYLNCSGNNLTNLDLVILAI